MKITKIKNPPPRGDFPKELGEKWGAIYDAALEKYKSKKIAAAVAWTVIKKSWHKDEKTGKWVRIKKTVKRKIAKKKTAKKKTTKRKVTKRKTTKRKVTKRKTKKKLKSTKK